MDRLTKKFERGGAALEILAVLLAMLILSVVAVASYAGRANDAKLTQASDDVVGMTQSQLEAARAHGVFVPLQVLDNATQDAASRTSMSDDPVNEPEAIHAIPVALGPQDKAGAVEPSVKSILGWKGPFASYRRVYFGSIEGRALNNVPEKLTPETLRRDYPLDPWGTPYRFYSPIGIIGTAGAKSTVDVLDTDAFSDGAVTTEDDRFDQYAIVSYGPDGQSDSISNGNDDIINLFMPESAPAR